jgi:hypothetical protein
MLSLLAPYSPFTPLAQAENSPVCCEAAEVDLYLLGDSDLRLSPFVDLLSETSSSRSFETAVASSEQIGKWELESAWPGTVPDATWSVELGYTVSDAGGANLNLSATITIGGSSFTGFLGIGSTICSAGEWNRYH